MPPIRRAWCRRSKSSAVPPTTPLPPRTAMPSPESPRDPARNAPRVIAVASGKGGVGKTSVSVNLSLALAHAGQRTMLLDTDLGLANVDVMLGLSPRFTLADVIAGRCDLADTVVEGPGGLYVVPA